MANMLVSRTPASREPLEKLTHNEAEAQQPHRVKAAEQIQQFWRSHYPASLAKRAFLETSMGRIFIHVLAMCNQDDVAGKMRHLLLGPGVGLLGNIRCLSSTASELQQRAVSLLDRLPQEKFELVDEILQRVSAIEESLENVGKTASTERLEELVKGGEAGNGEEVQHVFESAEAVLERLGGDVLKVRRMIEVIDESG